MAEDMNEVWQWKEGPIGRLVKTSYITLRREVEALLKPTGLTHTQWSAIQAIWRHPGVLPSQLELILMIERPSVTSLLQGLTKKGLIVQKSHLKDGRYKLIHLSEEGQKLAKETQYFTSEVERQAKEGMTAEEFETLRRLLIKLVGVFEDGKE